MLRAAPASACRLHRTARSSTAKGMCLIQMTNEAVRPSLARQIVDPIKGSKDLSIASKIIFSRSNTEKMSAFLASLLPPRSLFRRNITLSAPTFRALKNIMDKTGLLDFLARGSHFNIASDAERIVFRWLDHAQASPGSGSRFYVRPLA